jgi:hypothetical protein
MKYTILEDLKMKNLTRLFTAKMTAVLFVGVLAFGTVQIATAQSSSMGGHGSGMTKEDPVPFTRDMDKAATDILSQVKAGKTLDARNSLSRLTAAADKVTPHVTDAALKKRITDAVDGVKTIVNAKSPDLFDLEDNIEALQVIVGEARTKWQGMN